MGPVGATVKTPGLGAVLGHHPSMPIVPVFVHVAANNCAKSNIARGRSLGPARRGVLSGYLAVQSERVYKLQVAFLHFRASYATSDACPSSPFGAAQNPSRWLSPRFALPMDRSPILLPLIPIPMHRREPCPYCRHSFFFRQRQRRRRNSR